jgi:hypothetical protein
MKSEDNGSDRKWRNVQRYNKGNHGHDNERALIWRNDDPGYSSEDDVPTEKWKWKCGPKGEVTCERLGEQMV